MFLGHFAVAFGAKKAAPKTSLGTLFIASQFIDLLWPVLLLLGVEHVRVEPGNTVVTPLNFIDYPYSHSLLSVIVYSLLLSTMYWAFKRYPRGSSYPVYRSRQSLASRFHLSPARSVPVSRQFYSGRHGAVELPSRDPHCRGRAFYYRHYPLCESYEKHRQVRRIRIMAIDPLSDDYICCQYFRPPASQRSDHDRHCRPVIVVSDGLGLMDRQASAGRSIRLKSCNYLPKSPSHRQREPHAEMFVMNELRNFFARSLRSIKRRPDSYDDRMPPSGGVSPTSEVQTTMPFGSTSSGPSLPSLIR
jgi:hypothetical protein